MDKNRNQHYIPRLLLKRWQANTPGGLRIFRFQRGATSAEQKALSQVGSATDFYRDAIDPLHPDRLDDVLNQTESKIGTILDLILDTRQLPARNSEEFDRLVRFIHDLYLRTPAVRKRADAAAPSEMTRILATDIMVQHPAKVERALTELPSALAEGHYLSELYRQATGEIEVLSEESQRLLHYKLAAEAHPEILDQLNRRLWRLLIAPDSGPFFVIGDEPVVVHDSNANVRTGLKHRKSDVSIPVSPRVVLQGCLSPVRAIAELDAVRVRRLNGVLARIAFREVFACQEDFLWQHKSGKNYTAKDWMERIPQATWPSNLKS